MIAATSARMPRFTRSKPMPLSRRMLEANLHLNLMGDRVCVVSEAAGEHAGEAVLSLPLSKTHLIETAGSLNAKLYGQTRDQIRVKVTTLDEFVAERGVGPGRLDQDGR